MKMDFTIPFSGFASTTFINCFASVYMYLENMGWQAENMTYCNEWENGQCNGCGNCATKPQSRQERYFFFLIPCAAAVHSVAVLTAHHQKWNS